MKPPILRSHPGVEVFIDEGCHILELSNDDSDPALSIARARVEPGVTTKWHRLRDTVERYVILDGMGRVEIRHQSGSALPTSARVICCFWRSARRASGRTPMRM
jgi:hypothetical protein